MLPSTRWHTTGFEGQRGGRQSSPRTIESGCRADPYPQLRKVPLFAADYQSASMGPPVQLGVEKSAMYRTGRLGVYQPSSSSHSAAVETRVSCQYHSRPTTCRLHRQHPEYRGHSPGSYLYDGLIWSRVPSWTTDATRVRMQTFPQELAGLQAESLVG